MGGPTYIVTNTLLIVAIVLILIGAAMYVLGFDVPLPKIGSAAILVAAIGVIVLIIWLILLIIGQIPRT